MLPEASGSFCLSLAQFRRLWSDCCLGAYGVPFAKVHRLVAAMRAQHASEVAALTCARAAQGSAGGVPSLIGVRAKPTVTVTESAQSDLATVFRCDTPLLFREFVELLARVAVAAFADGSGEAHSDAAAREHCSHTAGAAASGATGSLHASTLLSTAAQSAATVHRPPANHHHDHFVPPSVCFSRLMDQAVQGSHSKTLVKGSFEAALVESDTQALFASNRTSLRAAFDFFAEPGGGVVTLRGLLRLLVFAGAGSGREASGLGLGLGPLLEMLVISSGGGDSSRGHASPLAADPTLLDVELTWDEFLEALAFVAHSARLADLPAFDDGSSTRGGSSVAGESVGSAGLDGFDDYAAEAEDTVGAGLPGPSAGAFGSGMVGSPVQPLQKHLASLLARLDFDSFAQAATDDEAPAAGAPAARPAASLRPLPRPPRRPVVM